MGAGFWAEWGRIWLADQAESLPYGWWLLAGGSVVLGVGIWVGTSGDPIVHVGDAGVAQQRTGAFGTMPLQRMPWHAVASIAFDGAMAAVVVRGKDETGADLTIVVRLKSQPQAAAWIVREARARVASVTTVGDEVKLAEARNDAGEGITLEPLQIVGKRCAASGKIIAFEPDARVCPNCERVYHKEHVPDACECGQAMRARSDATAGDEPHAEGQGAQPA
jgi:hypothetical protein